MKGMMVKYPNSAPISFVFPSEEDARNALLDIHQGKIVYHQTGGILIRPGGVEAAYLYRTGGVAGQF